LEPVERASATQAPEPEDHFSPDTAGGVIPVEKPPGRGTPASPRIKDDQETIQPGDLVILVIEDDPNFAGIIFRFSHEKGFKCLHAADGETGLELVEKFMPDAVILDIGLPGMDGYTVLNRLKDNDKTRNIPVHIMSAYDQDTEALNQRTIGYLKKPVLKKDLDTAFARIRTNLSKQMRKLLLVEDDGDQSLAIQKVIDRDDLEMMVATTGRDALDLLKTQNFDGVVLDLNLPDMSGHELLARLKEENLHIPPVVIYTAEEISRREEADLREFTPSIILKGAMSIARLKDETALFLHRVVKDLPQEKQERISHRRNFNEEFADRSILLVDDDMRNVFAVGKILSDSGMKVHKAADGRKALEILAKEPDIDLVLMDIMMPVMDGYTAIENIRRSEKNYSDIPIIALTAKAMPEDRKKCLNAGANDYLTKPIDIDLLFSMLHNYLEKPDGAEDKEHKNGE
jgi:CheY-like chemotaxis protein